MGSQTLMQNAPPPMKLRCELDGSNGKDRINVLVPFDDLLVRVVVAVVAGKSVGVHETTERVTAL